MGCSSRPTSRVAVSHLQIPSDLLSFAGAPAADAASRVAAVTGYVAAVRGMVGAGEAHEIRGRQQEDAYDPTQSNSAVAASLSAPPAESVSPPADSASMAGPPVDRSTGLARMFDFAYAGAAAPKRRSPGASGSAPTSSAGGSARAGSGSLPSDRATPGLPKDTAKRRSAPRPTDEGNTGTTIPSSTTRDHTTIPVLLDAAYARFDADAALHSTTVSAGSIWERSTYRSLLSRTRQIESIGAGLQAEATAAAFDLLDALSRR